MVIIFRKATIIYIHKKYFNRVKYIRYATNQNYLLLNQKGQSI